MQFSTLGGPYCKAKDGGGFGVSLHLERRKRGGVAFNWLRTLSLDRIQLHGPHNPGLLGCYADQKQPVLFRIGAIIDYLAAVQQGVAKIEKDIVQSRVFPAKWKNTTNKRFR